MRHQVEGRKHNVHLRKLQTSPHMHTECKHKRPTLERERERAGLVAKLAGGKAKA